MSAWWTVISLTFFFFAFPVAHADFDGGGEEGGWISGGGDPLRIYFEEARLYARELVANTNLEPGKIVTAEVAEWFARNKAALASDLEASAHEWHENNQTTCAFTEYRPNAPVKLSFDSCRSITSATEAAKVLVHESVHHLGVADHSFADKVAVQLVAFWEMSKLNRIASCPERSPPLVRNMIGKWRMDPALGKLLSEGADRLVYREIEFKADPSSLAQFNEYRAFHGGCALSAGTLRLVPNRGQRERTVPYFIRRNGLQLFLVTFRSEEDLAKKKLSARLIQLVKSESRGSDRLVVTSKPLLGERARGPNAPAGVEIETFQRMR